MTAAAFCVLSAGYGSAQTVESVNAGNVQISVYRPSEASKGEAVNAKQVYAIPQKPQAIPQPKYKTSGREFYVVFLSTVGNDPLGSPSPKKVYISSRSHTRGRIYHVGGTWSFNFECLPRSITPITLPTWCFLDRNETEFKYPRLFAVETDDDVAVYAMSMNYLSTDGYLVLPKQTLGTEYMISSLRNALWYYSGVLSPWYANNNVPRSEFGVAAIEDGTDVTIELAADSWSGKYKKGNLYSFTLNRGEVIQFMARDTGKKALVDYWDNISKTFVPKLSWVGKDSGVDCDLTGSIVASTKPVAVFAGHERASAPDSLEFAWFNHPPVSRDHLIEQMPPVAVWGKEFIALGGKQDDRNSRPTGGDLVRVIARYDGTIVTRNGVRIDSIGKNGFTQFYSGEYSHITTSEPALVVKYLLTGDPFDKDSLYLGDPDMTVVPPVENMSTFYAVPTIAQGISFTHHFVNIIVDSAALNSTLFNTLPIDPKRYTPIPNTRYLYAKYQTYAGEQRLESSLPAYMETYGYGNHDSYSLAGGGDFKYILGLKAFDLDFGMLELGATKDSVSSVLADIAPSPLADTIELFHYSWDYGDTVAFALLDTINGKIRLAPGESQPVRFRFTPTHLGKHTARLRVWSNNMYDVFINLVGAAGTRNLDVIPSSIKFPPTRVNRIDTIPYTVVATFEAALRLDIEDKDWNDFCRSGAFKTTQRTPLQPANGLNYQDSIMFTPPYRGYFTDTIIYYNNGIDTPTLAIFGRGIAPDIRTAGYDFGEIRFKQQSPWQKLVITNIGDDSTSIVSIRLASGDINDFELKPSTLPSPVSPFIVDTIGSSGDRNTASYEARFVPKEPVGFDPDGRRMAVVEIVTSDEVRYDTLRGRGVEPWLRTAPDTLDFGDIIDPPFGGLMTRTLPFSVRNDGTMNALLYSLSVSDPAHYTVLNAPSFENKSYPVNALDNPDAEFTITSRGLFIDSVVASNDSRIINGLRPVVYLKARVLSRGRPNTFDIDLGEIADCKPIDTTITIRNSSSVSIEMDSLFFDGAFGGFTWVDEKTTILPVRIPAGGSYPLRLRYVFPPDSVNGTQQAYFIIRQPYGGELTGYFYDTIRLTINRKVIVLSIGLIGPPFKPNALDDPFRLPVHINGDRLGKTPLDNFTVILRFNNDIIEPIGIDRTGSGTDVTTQNPIPPQPPGVWDPAARTYTVQCKDLLLSQSPGRNTLLFTVMCKAYLTPDTDVKVVQEIRYDNGEPCAFRVLRDSLTIAYADECGDETIRSVLLSGRTAISFSPAVPDPAPTDKPVSISYFAAVSGYYSWKLYDASGTEAASSGDKKFTKGSGELMIPPHSVSQSGAYLLEITTRDDQNRSGRTAVKIAYIR